MTEQRIKLDKSDKMLHHIGSDGTKFYQLPVLSEQECNQIFKDQERVNKLIEIIETLRKEQQYFEGKQTHVHQDIWIHELEKIKDVK